MIHRLVAPLTRSRLLTRILFGVSVPSARPGEHWFDATTVGMRPTLLELVPRGARVLDMGTGSAAVLGLWLWRRLGCKVTCSDVDPSIAARALANVKRNGASVGVICSRYFKGLRGGVDYVVFNPPYVSTAIGTDRRLPEHLRSQWDGGPKGTTVLEGFLAAFERDGEDATAIVGVNRAHVTRRDVEALVAGREVELLDVRAHRLLPVDAYVLVRRKSPKASESRPEA